MITIRRGKGGKARRVPLHVDAQEMVQRYLDEARCPNGLPAIGSNGEREPLLMRKAGLHTADRHGLDNDPESIAAGEN
jgi:site-specific recombinase XerD